jgi:hypothetical protein
MEFCQYKRVGRAWDANFHQMYAHVNYDAVVLSSLSCIFGSLSECKFINQLVRYAMRG